MVLFSPLQGRYRMSFPESLIEGRKCLKAARLRDFGNGAVFLVGGGQQAFGMVEAQGGDELRQGDAKLLPDEPAQVRAVYGDASRHAGEGDFLAEQFRRMEIVVYSLLLLGCGDKSAGLLRYACLPSAGGEIRYIRIASPDAEQQMPKEMVVHEACSIEGKKHIAHDEETAGGGRHL